MPKYKDPKTGHFINEEEAKKRGIPPVTGFDFQESVEKYVKDVAKAEKISEEEVIKDLFNREVFLVEFDEAKGTASLKILEGTPYKEIKDMNSEELMAEYKDLRENFAPVAAGIEYHKTFLCGSGFDVIVDNPRDKHQLEMRDEILKLCGNMFMDFYYKQGLDKLLFIMADDLLTFGAVAGRIQYGRPIPFEEFAEIKGEQKTTAGAKLKIWKTRDPEKQEWKTFKGIERLIIIDRAISRLNPYVEDFQVKYWTLDTPAQTPAEEILHTKPESIKYHPFEIFWLSWNTRGTGMKGESIIRPALEIARLVRRIQRAIGKGFERWADRKYFFICGTERRPWGRNAQRRFIHYLELMIKNNWTGVPVPTGFDVKEIGGQVFEGTNILNHLINMICAAMNYPRDFLEQGRTAAGDKAWLAWQVKYGSNQRMLRRDIEQQLFQKHLWCKFGFTYRVPKQNVPSRQREVRDIYIPKIIWKAEGRWQRAEELKSLLGTLNVANPIGVELKLAVEKRIAEILGFGEIEFPSYAELRKEMKAIRQMQELELQTRQEKMRKRQEKGVSKRLAPTGQIKKPPPSAGGTRKAKLIQKGMKAPEETA